MLSFLKKITQFLMLLVVMSVFGVGKVKAQSITPAQDGTGTSVTTDGNGYDINGGSLSGDSKNLFHSFEQFGLSQGEIANFLANPNLENILGRIGGGNPSIINGLIQVTGGNANLFLMNPAGFVFGNSARLDVSGSFTATTANGIGFGGSWFSATGGNDYPALLGNPTRFGFTMAQPGRIVNEGKLAVGEGQNLSLIGGTVVNTGELKAPGGGVVVSAVAGENLVRLSIPGNVLSLEVQPLAGSQPNDWNVPIPALPDLLTVGAAGVQGNPDGTVNVAGVQVPGESGTVVVSGKVDVSGERGGNVGVFGDKVAVVGAEIDASGVNGGGRVLVGGDYKGEGSVPNAQRTLVDGASRINADALTNGNGGVVIIWADGTTGFSGNVSARGGTASGDGGFVEVSGKENLIFRGNVDVSAIRGKVGILLLDPKNIRIVDGNGGTNDAALDDKQILAGDNNGQTFTISEKQLEEQKGNVRLEATNDITIEDLFDDELNLLKANSIIFIADADGNGVGSFVMNNQKILVVGTDNSGIDIISTNRGDLTIQGASITAGGIISSGNVKLISTSGDVVVRFIKISSSDVTIKANRLFRATGAIDASDSNITVPESSPKEVVSILSTGFFPIETETENNENFSGGQINITHGGTAFVTGVKAEGNPTDSPKTIFSLILIDPFSFPDGASGTRGAIVSRNINGALGTVYVDTGLSNTPGLTPRIGITFSPPSTIPDFNPNPISKADGDGTRSDSDPNNPRLDSAVDDAGRKRDSEGNKSGDPICESSDPNQPCESSESNSETNNDILDVSDVLPPKPSN